MPLDLHRVHVDRRRQEAVPPPEPRRARLVVDQLDVERRQLPCRVGRGLLERDQDAARRVARRLHRPVLEVGPPRLGPVRQNHLEILLAVVLDSEARGRDQVPLGALVGVQPRRLHDRPLHRQVLVLHDPKPDPDRVRQVLEGVQHRLPLERGDVRRELRRIDRSGVLQIGRGSDLHIGRRGDRDEPLVAQDIEERQVRCLDLRYTVVARGSGRALRVGVLDLLLEGRLQLIAPLRYVVEPHQEDAPGLLLHDGPVLHPLGRDVEHRDPGRQGHAERVHAAPVDRVGGDGGAAHHPLPDGQKGARLSRDLGLFFPQLHLLRPGHRGVAGPLIGATHPRLPAGSLDGPDHSTRQLDLHAGSRDDEVESHDRRLREPQGERARAAVVRGLRQVLENQGVPPLAAQRDLLLAVLAVGAGGAAVEIEARQSHPLAEDRHLHPGVAVQHLHAELQPDLRARLVGPDHDARLAGGEGEIDGWRRRGRLRVRGADLVQDLLEVAPRDEDAGILQPRQPVVLSLALRLARSRRRGDHAQPEEKGKKKRRARNPPALRW